MDETDAQVNAIIRRLVQLADRGDDVRAALVQDPTCVTREVADTAAMLLQRAKTDRDPRATRAFGLVAFHVYDALGEPAEAMRSTIPNLELGLVLAETLSEYVSVMNAALQKSQQAASVGAREVAVALSVVAADCMYFAAETVPAAQAHSLHVAGLAALTGDDSTPPALSPPWTFRFASVSGALVHNVLGHASPNEAVPALLRSLARMCEAIVPADYAPAHDTVSIEVQLRALAALSYHFGSAEIAESRVAVLMARAPDDAARAALERVRDAGRKTVRARS